MSKISNKTGQIVLSGIVALMLLFLIFAGEETMPGPAFGTAGGVVTYIGIGRLLVIAL